MPLRLILRLLLAGLVVGLWAGLIPPLLLLPPTPTTPNDWPMFRHDPAHTGYNPNSSFARTHSCGV